MSNLESLEKRIQALEDIEAIRQLRFYYWWYLDHKEWDKFADLFTDDLVYTNLATGQQKSKADWLPGLDKFLGEHVRSCHHGHQHVIDIVDETHATGIWVLRDDLYNIRANTEFLGRAWYFDKYRKENGVWKISAFALIYNMAKGGGVNAYAADTAPELMSIGWDIGQLSWKESNSAALDAIKAAGWEVK